MTLDDLRAFTGVRLGGELRIRCRGKLVETSWQDPVTGWWWALTSDDYVIAMGWSTSDTRDRDTDIARALLPAPTEVHS